MCGSCLVELDGRHLFYGDRKWEKPNGPSWCYMCIKASKFAACAYIHMRMWKTNVMHLCMATGSYTHSCTQPSSTTQVNTLCFIIWVILYSDNKGNGCSRILIVFFFVCIMPEKMYTSRFVIAWLSLKLHPQRLENIKLQIHIEIFFS